MVTTNGNGAHSEGDDSDSDAYGFDGPSRGAGSLRNPPPAAANGPTVPVNGAPAKGSPSSASVAYSVPESVAVYGTGIGGFVPVQSLFTPPETYLAVSGSLQGWGPCWARAAAPWSRSICSQGGFGVGTQGWGWAARGVPDSMRIESATERGRAGRYTRVGRVCVPGRGDAQRRSRRKASRPPCAALLASLPRHALQPTFYRLACLTRPPAALLREGSPLPPSVPARGCISPAESSLPALGRPLVLPVTRPACPPPPPSPHPPSLLLLAPAADTPPPFLVLPLPLPRWRRWEKPSRSCRPGKRSCWLAWRACTRQCSPPCCSW